MPTLKEQIQNTIFVRRKNREEEEARRAAQTEHAKAQVIILGINGMVAKALEDEASHVDIMQLEDMRWDRPLPSQCHGVAALVYKYLVDEGLDEQCVVFWNKEGADATCWLRIDLSERFYV